MALTSQVSVEFQGQALENRPRSARRCEGVAGAGVEVCQLRQTDKGEKSEPSCFRSGERDYPVERICRISSSACCR